MIDKGGNTLLHQATARGKKEVVRELIMQGLDPLKLNDFGKSSVGIAEDFRGCGKAYRETFSFLSVEGQALAIEMAAKPPAARAASASTTATPQSLVPGEQQWAQRLLGLGLEPQSVAELIGAAQDGYAGGRFSAAWGRV